MAKVFGGVPDFAMAGPVSNPEEHRTDTFFTTYSADIHSPTYTYEGTGFVYDIFEPTEEWALPHYLLVEGRVFSASSSVGGRHLSGRDFRIESDLGWDAAELFARRTSAFFHFWILAGDDEVETQYNFQGHGGNDVIRYVAANPTTAISTDSVRLEGGEGDDFIVGGHAKLTILEGGEGSDHLKGGVPYDGVTGGIWREEMYGGAGNDRMEGGLYEDLLDGGDGVDAAYYLNSAAGVTVDLAAGAASGGEADGDSFVSIENLHGSAHADTLSGDDGANLIIGEAGDDVLEGRAGADTLIGGEGNDRLDGGSNPDGQGDFLLGGAGDDTYVVDSPLDFVDEGSASPEFGFGGVDTIVSTADFFWDVYSVGEVAQVSEDVVDVGGDGVTLVGGVFDNRLIGHSGADILFGRGGSDTYRAGDGIDWISLSTLGVMDAEGYTANGPNTVIVEQRRSGDFSYDIVFEFESGLDRLDVSDYSEANGFASGDDVLSLAVEDGAGNTYFALGDGFDYLFMVDRDIAAFSAADFIV